MTVANTAAGGDPFVPPIPRRKNHFVVHYTGQRWLIRIHRNGKVSERDAGRTRGEANQAAARLIGRGIPGFVVS